MTHTYAANLLTRFARILAAEGYGLRLQPVQWQALRYLASANRFSRTAKGLTAWLGQTKGSVSQSLIILETKGLIARESDKADGRIVRLDLTQAGHDLLSRAPESLARRMLGHLPDDKQAEFTHLIDTMLKEEIKSKGGRPFGVCHECRYFERAPVSDAGHYCRLLEVDLSEDESLLICYEQERI
jgi:DNA-binding MarR family transcriptional regulator